ncbi:MAG: DUF192 domain-containing protein [Planctomycetes bacterium]|nr:DUF192 domain-containing protein [Planctomycetota bacterium]MCP4839547.1 DUF192 domain-containing protein [Planctomycetota bacterium]
MAHLKLIPLLVLLLTAVACEHRGPRVEQVQIGDQEWLLEVAASQAAIQQGLMGRPSIPVGTGMLFVFDQPAVHRFWMADCLVDIDLIFIDGQGRITATHMMKVEPAQGPGESQTAYEQRLPLYSSRIPSRYAIELPAGSITALGLRAGEPIDLDLPRLRSLAE